MRRYGMMLMLPTPARAVLLALSLVVAAAPCRAGDAAQPGIAPADPVSGLRVYIDPETGEFTHPPDGLAPEVTGSFSAAGGAADATESLPTRPSESSAGGVIVDLRGRFLTGMKVGTDAHGHAVADCVSNLPDPRVER